MKMYWIFGNLLFYIFLWTFKITAAYEEFCEEFFPEMMCTCDVDYLHTKMMCFVQSDMDEDNKLWREMSSVENVVVLKLNANLRVIRFTKIPSDSLRRMAFLEHLEIQQANLTELKSYAISDLKILRVLKLENCEISELQSNAITNLPRLKKLSLSDNLIEEINADALTSLLELENLFLERNRISRIGTCAFCDLQNLRELNLFENEIEDLTEYMFRGIRLLTRLDLSNNKIRILNDKIFHALPKLDDLDLHSNAIYHIGPRAFQGLEKLRSLNLKMNKIKMLPDAVFKSLPSLRSVDLDKNELITLQEEVLKNMDKVKDPHFYFHVSNNSFVCDCRLAWVKTYIHHNYSYYLTKELMQLQCHTEDEKLSMQFAHKMKMDCSKFVEQQKTTTTTTPWPVTEQPAKLVPYEIHKSKNRTINDLSADSENNDIIQDSEAIDNSDETNDSGPSGSKAVVADFNLIMLATLLTLFLVRKRKGTCF
ncbi:phospholipase A2 inhibitor beta [Parasteatoda tepidariorum]|nr:connectin [Parasteatoda tepidariorum]XP_042906189.1 connectin [Parasteatoda tepidariorum]